MVSMLTAPSDFDRSMSLELLIGKLNSENPSDHAIARQLLPLKPPMDVLPKIIPCLQSTNPDISGTARNILFDITNRLIKTEMENKQIFYNKLINYFEDTSLSDSARDVILKTLILMIDEQTDLSVLREYLLDPQWREKVRVAFVENGTRNSAQLLCDTLDQIDTEGKISILLGLYQMGEVPCTDKIYSLLNDNNLSIKSASAMVLSNTGVPIYAPRLLEICTSVNTIEPVYKELWDAYIRLAENVVLKGGNWDYAMEMYRSTLQFCKDSAILQSAITGLGRFGDASVLPTLIDILSDTDKRHLYRSVFHAITLLYPKEVEKQILQLCSKISTEQQVLLIPLLVQYDNNEEAKKLVIDLLNKPHTDVKRVFLNAFYEEPSLKYVDYVPLIMPSLDDSEKQKLGECLWRTVSTYKQVEENEKQFIGKAYLYLFKLCPPEEQEIVLEGIKKFPTLEAINVLLPELEKEDPKKLPFPLLFELWCAIPEEDKEQKEKIKNILIEQLANVSPIDVIISTLSNSKNLSLFSSLVGFVENWNLIGPFPWSIDNPFRESYGFPQAVVDLNSPLEFQQQKYSWKKNVKAEGWGYIGLISLCEQNASECSYLSAFAYTEIELPEETDAFVNIGSDDGFRLWVNQQEVAKKHVDRGMKVDDDKIQVHFNNGVNKILLQITQIKGGWNFCLRLTDLSGKPLPFNVKTF